MYIHCALKIATFGSPVDTEKESMNPIEMLFAYLQEQVFGPVAQGTARGLQ